MNTQVQRRMQMVMYFIE